MDRKTLIAIHAAYWFYLLFILEIVMKLAYKSLLADPGVFFKPLALSNYIIFPLIFYTNYNLVLPRLLKKNKYTLTILSWVLLSFIFVAIRYFIQEYLFLKYLGVCNYCDIGFSVYFLNNFLQGLMYLVVPGTVIWLIDTWFTSEKQKLELQREKVKSESAFLQSQLTPHFLFNNLHTIYSMVFHRSEEALPAIKKLSDILRYSINENRLESVALKLEIEHLEDYIELHKFRIINPAVVLEVNCDSEKYRIQPLLLITLVENAFKHGVGNDPENPIRICLHADQGKLHFTIKNRINPYKNDLSLGTGLGNVKKRLKLYYKDRSELDTEEKDGLFITDLKINLS